MQSGKARRAREREADRSRFDDYQLHEYTVGEPPDSFDRRAIPIKFNSDRLAESGPTRLGDMILAVEPSLADDSMPQQEFVFNSEDSAINNELRDEPVRLPDETDRDASAESFYAYEGDSTDSVDNPSQCEDATVMNPTTGDGASPDPSTDVTVDPEVNSDTEPSTVVHTHQMPNPSNEPTEPANVDGSPRTRVDARTFTPPIRTRQRLNLQTNDAGGGFRWRGFAIGLAVGTAAGVILLLLVSLVL
jgi:hypothetical protein